MHRVIIFILLTISLTTEAQLQNPSGYSDGHRLVRLTYDDHLEKSVAKVAKYQIDVTLKGKVGKDSTLTFFQTINKDDHSVEGGYSIWQISENQSFNAWYLFIDSYDTLGRIVMRKDKPNGFVNKIKGTTNEFSYHVEEIHYSYNYDNLLVKKTHDLLTHLFSLSEKTKDTLQQRWTKFSKKYEYDSNLNETKRYYSATGIYNKVTNMRSRFFEADNDNRPMERYLKSEKKYNQNGQAISWKTYSKEGLELTKKFFLYNDNNQLKMQVDSTGWSNKVFYDEPPSIFTTKEYFYEDTALIRTKTNEKDFSFDMVFDKNGRVTKSCKYAAKKYKLCSYNNYTFNNDVLEKIVIEADDKSKYIALYNEKSLPVEEKNIDRVKMYNLTRYYYTY